MATPATELDVDGIKVRFTNPDKVYYPKLGSAGTKGKLMEYYLSVADRMVTLLKDRPTHSSTADWGMSPRWRSRTRTRSGAPPETFHTMDLYVGTVTDLELQPLD